MPISKFLFHRLFFILLFCIYFSGCSALFDEEVKPMIPTSSEFTFERYEVITGLTKRQTVLSGFLLSGAMAELAVLNDDRRLHIYTFENRRWVPKIDLILRPGVLFVDVVNIGGQDCLITYEEGSLNCFDSELASERVLLTVTAIKPPHSGEIPHVDITRDVNHDGIDDLVVPDVDGFQVFIQKHDGTFAEPIKLGTAPEFDEHYEAGGYRYTPWNQSRIHEIDYNRDGRSDLVFWNEDHFVVHLQDEQGLFVPEPKTFTTDVVFDSNELASLAAPKGVRSRRKDNMPTGAMTGRVLHSLADLNGDNIADLSVFSLKGGGLWNMHSTYEVHFGIPTPDGGTVFSPEIATTIESDGIPFGVEQHDFDQDGQVDMMFTTINPGVFKAIGMLVSSILTRSVLLDLHCYYMENGSYSNKANTIRKIKSQTPDETMEKTLFPAVLLGNVNGDKYTDLVMGWGRKELHVFLGVPGPDLFARKPKKIAVAMPNEEYTWLVDLNKDGKQDILLHHLSTTEPHRVTILIAQ